MNLKEKAFILSNYCDKTYCSNCPLEGNTFDCQFDWNKPDNDIEICYDMLVKANKLEEDVTNPQHYKRDGAMECIDEMINVFGKNAVMNFCICNVWKYRYRASDKNGEDDLKKADWYMKKYTELKEEIENEI